MVIENRTRKFEILAVAVTALSKFIFMDWLEWRLIYIFLAIAFWVTYVTIQHKKSDDILKYWGFTKENLSIVLKQLAPFGLLSVIGFFAIGYANGTINMTWHLIPILILYPIWGVIQQFLVVGLVAGNLQDYEGLKMKKVSIIFITAILFAAVHYPYWWLMLGTFVLAILYSYIYLKVKNLYALGLYHGWLGGLFFYTVVNRDPWVEVFEKF